jgi:hypothetical protein
MKRFLLLAALAFALTAGSVTVLTKHAVAGCVPRGGGDCELCCMNDDEW